MFGRPTSISKNAGGPDPSRKEGGVHPPSPGALVAAARVGTKAHLHSQRSRRTCLRSSGKCLIVLRFLSGTAGLTRGRDRSSPPASCRPIWSARSAPNDRQRLQYEIHRSGLLKPLSPLNLSAIARMSTDAVTKTRGAAVLSNDRTPTSLPRRCASASSKPDSNRAALQIRRCELDRHLRQPPKYLDSLDHLDRHVPKPVG